jgi:hypothetical protein
LGWPCASKPTSQHRQVRSARPSGTDRWAQAQASRSIRPLRQAVQLPGTIVPGSDHDPSGLARRILHAQVVAFPHCRRGVRRPQNAWAWVIEVCPRLS